jgi:hypothetical protein
MGQWGSKRYEATGINYDNAVNNLMIVLRNSGYEFVRRSYDDKEGNRRYRYLVKIGDIYHEIYCSVSDRGYTVFVAL